METEFGGRTLREDKVAHRTASSDGYGLTARERMVLNLLASGRSNKQIAGMLCISVPTVNSHVAKILRKMGARSRTEASIRALQEALIT